MRRLKTLLAVLCLIVGIGLAGALPASAHDTSAAGMSALCDNTDHYSVYFRYTEANKGSAYHNYVWVVGSHTGTAGKLWFCSVLFVTGTTHGTTRTMNVAITENESPYTTVLDVGEYGHYAGPIKIKGCDLAIDASADMGLGSVYFDTNLTYPCA